MKILGLDSSGLVASVAIVEDGVLLAEYTTDYKKTHSQTLLPMLDELRNMIELDVNSLDAIAIASGPGSFTGLRIGSATAKGLGLALKKPLVEVPTLEGLAWNLWGTDRLVCPIMDARRNQVYTAVYEFLAQGEEFVLHDVIPQSPMDIGELVKRLNAIGRPVIFLGDGVPVYLSKIREKLKVAYSLAPAGNNRQRAASVAALGAVCYAQGKTVDAAEHQPEYLRKSQAERERELVIRELREEDIPRLAEIESESFSMPWSAEQFKELLAHDYCTYVVALTEGKVAGCCGFTDSCNVASIDNVVVAPEFRNRGIAQAMLRELIRRGEEKKIEAFTLEVRVGNMAAVHAYEKLGFRSEGIRPRFYEKPVEDANIMWKRY